MLTVLLSLLACLLGSAVVYAQTMYKWVDETGQVHYTSTLPPAAVKHDRRVLSKRGTVVKTLEGERTPEELEAEMRRQEMETLKQKEHETQQKHDKALMVTYNSEDDILLARDKKLIFFDEQIVGAELRIEEERQEYNKLVKEAANVERSGGMASEDLKASIRIVKRKIDEFEHRLAENRREKETAILSFNEDLRRFRELTGKASSE